MKSGDAVYLPYAPLDAGVVLEVADAKAKVLWLSGEVTLCPLRDLQRLEVLIGLHQRKVERHQKTILRLRTLAAERGLLTQ